MRDDECVKDANEDDNLLNNLGGPTGGSAGSSLGTRLNSNFTNPSPKAQTGNQRTLLQLAKEAIQQAKAGNPISYDEACILDEWAAEYGVPQHHPAQIGSGAHWSAGYDHTHIYNRHVPFHYTAHK